ncbi:MAG: EAL domain-containing protein [Phycisphaerae bacterium]
MMSTTSIARRILIVDDQESIRADYAKILTPPPTRDAAALGDAKAALFGGAARPTANLPSFLLQSASQGEEGVACIRAARDANESIMVAFVDMRMPPGMDGLCTIEGIWTTDPRVQVVLATAYSDHTLEDISRRLGPSDRLVILKKPFDNAEITQLALTLSEKWLAERAAEARVGELEHAVLERTNEIEHALMHDRLTGLPNRTSIQNRLEYCLQRRKRHAEQKFALLYIDFDRFKVINDSLGHEVGDLLLIEISRRLRDALRESDSVQQLRTPSRIGGDEFLVLLEDLSDERDAARVAERLLQVLGEPYDVVGNTIQVTPSVGIATSDQEYEHASEMVRDADTAMYRAKAAGRNRIVMFDAEMHAAVMRRMAIEHGLRNAIREESVEVYFQPIVSLAERRICGFEALLRWRHPTLGPISAIELVTLAEDTGLIHPLSLIILRKACDQLRVLQNVDPRPESLTVAVNLSRRQLIDPQLTAKIANVVRGSGIEPGTLVLEVTESTALAEDGSAERALQSLRDLGIWLHLDDFGTGYSSLSCLYRLPLTGLKIDRAFTRSVFEHPQHRSVLEAIVTIARAFKLQIVAEGVETTEQFELLRELGIEHAQGYLFGKPVAAAHTISLIGRTIPESLECLAAFS